VLEGERSEQMPDGRGYLITLDGIDSTTIPEMICHRVVRTLLGKNRNVFVDVPGRDGSWFFPQKKGMRTIKIEGSVLTSLVPGKSFPIDRRDAIERLADWMDKDGMVKMEISDHPGRYNLVSLSSEVSVDEWRHKGTFSAEFLADPYTYDNDTSSESITFVPNDSPSTIAFPDTVDAYPIVEITANGGAINGGTLVVNGYELSFTETIGSGEKMTVSSLSYIVVPGANTDTECSGSFDPGSIAMVGISGMFPILISGATQSIELTSASTSATNATLSFLWRRRYR
jgi:phage-related protein